RVADEAQRLGVAGGELGEEALEPAGDDAVESAIRRSRRGLELRGAGARGLARARGAPAGGGPPVAGRRAEPGAHARGVAQRVEALVDAHEGLLEQVLGVGGA